MSVSSYLTGLAGAAIIRDQEKAGIQRSINTLQTRLDSYFGKDISDSFIFGSYSRGTILPRYMDGRSDVDYMVVFTDSNYRPQTYLDRLKKFVDFYYSSSEIAQSNPTIVLSLNHIRFELVPATQTWLYGLQIPAPASDYRDWIQTSPTDFNQKLVQANQSHGNLIKPLVRLMKYWNAQADYPFESYNLEQDIVGHGWGYFGLLSTPNLADYFFDFVGGMETSIFAPQWKREAVERAKNIVSLAKVMERSGSIGAAEARIRKLLPPVGGLLA